MKHQKLETTPETSRRMSRVRLKRGAAERALAKALWHKGYRYRLNWRALPGRDWERRKPRLKRNRAYWIEKIEENMARDRRNDALLRAQGWSVLHFWEEEVKRDLAGCVAAVEDQLLDDLIDQQEEP